MDWTALTSSTIEAIAYEPTSQRLMICFKSGGRYSYADVPQNVFDGLASAESPGQYFRAHIREKYKGTPEEP